MKEAKKLCGRVTCESLGEDGKSASLTGERLLIDLLFVGATLEARGVASIVSLNASQSKKIYYNIRQKERK